MAKRTRRNGAISSSTGQRRNERAAFEGDAMATLIEGRGALIVTDMQQGGSLPLEEAGIPLMPGFAEQVERVVRVVDACRAASVPVVISQEMNRRDLGDLGRGREDPLHRG